MLIYILNILHNYTIMNAKTCSSQQLTRVLCLKMATTMTLKYNALLKPLKCARSFVRNCCFVYLLKPEHISACFDLFQLKNLRNNQLCSWK